MSSARDHGDMDAGVRAHIAGFWPDNPHEEFVWELGPISASLPQFRVRRVAPKCRSEPWVYVTVGAWRTAAGGREAREFFLPSPREESLHVETLAMVAHRPRSHFDLHAVLAPDYEQLPHDERLALLESFVREELTSLLEGGTTVGGIAQLVDEGVLPAERVVGTARGLLDAASRDSTGGR